MQSRKHGGLASGMTEAMAAQADIDQHGDTDASLHR